ncbi:MAG: hypothetical protein B6D44_16270 [Ignavibacteriales bacterium UTCHB2]|jgi:hypothetical protein|nr:MAG: hypothetical protein B6D44_16270 [Ignavibacteriales bacterium UTCHB2]
MHSQIASLFKPILKYLLFITLIFSSISSFAQNDDYQLGLSQDLIRQNQGAYYDYSDPGGLNIKVSVWGYVKYPGRYIIPDKSIINDLISYSGGISDDSKIDEMRIFRVNPDSSQEMLLYNYEDLWWSETLQKQITITTLQPGDVLIVPGRPRWYWENYLTLTLSIVGVLLSLATLIITANN